MEHQSVWLATAERPAYPPVDRGLSADVAVIGAGITGLTTALLAQRAGAQVVLIEARQIASGTSGATTGKVTAQHGGIYRDLVHRHGVAHARRYAEANRAGLAQIAALADEIDVDCGFTRAPDFVYGRSPESAEDLAAEAEQARTLGLPAVFDTDAGLPFEVTGAVRFDEQAHLHAGRYLSGLAAAFVAAGGRIHERSRVLSVDDAGDAVAVTVGEHVVDAGACVVATLLPIGLLGGCFARTTPSRSYGLALRLAGDAPRAMTIAIDSGGHSTRPWPQAGPTGLVVVGEGHQVGADVDTRQRYVALERWARSVFDVDAVDYRWSAHDYATADHLPYVGRAPSRRHVFLATGFAKWGLTNGTAAALMLTDTLAGRESPWLPAFDVGRLGDAAAIIEAAKANVANAVQWVRGGLDADTPSCTHLGCGLRWNPAEESWDCSCHGSRFTAEGDVIAGPAVRPLEWNR